MFELVPVLMFIQKTLYLVLYFARNVLIAYVS